jgi:predicted nucleotide-binding protein
VVLEAGFFISAKGKDRVLIVRPKESKMPADLGGDIYAALEDKSDIAPIEASIRAFAENLYAFVRHPSDLSWHTV